MDNKGIKEIIDLNKEFYSKHNESFDKSRSFGFWEGFEEIIKFIPNNPKVLDLGCGNGRFLKFLLEKNILIESYLGIDNSQEFVLKNQEIYKNYNFEIKDVIFDIDKIYEKYSLLVGFGITHHIPNKELRKNWFHKIGELVSNEGIIVLSFWNFEKNKTDFNFKPENYLVESGDYFLGWKESFSHHRYCHFYEEEELKEITNQFNNFELLSKFEKDKNTYLILKKK